VENYKEMLMDVATNPTRAYSYRWDQGPESA